MVVFKLSLSRRNARPHLVAFTTSEKIRVSELTVAIQEENKYVYSRLPHNSYLSVDSPEYALLGSMCCESRAKNRFKIP